MAGRGRIANVVAGIGECRPAFIIALLPAGITDPGYSYAYRTSERNCDLIGAVLGARFAHLVGERGAPLVAGGIRVEAVVCRRRDYRAIAVDVDLARSRPAPREVHRFHSVHLIAGGS
jgi:hypothetical protein